MKKVFIIGIVLAMTSFTAFAQKGNNQIGIGLDLGLPVGDFGDGSNFGIGGTAKGMYGIGNAGQVELTVGYISFGSKESTSEAKASTGIIPIFAGYRHHLNQFYLEPQLGLSMISSKATVMGNSFSSSTTAFGWALGIGYEFDAFDLSARYQSASKSGGSLGFFGLRIGYNFPF